MTATAMFNQVQFSDADVVNKDDYIPAGEYNLHNVCPWLLHDHGIVVAVVFASNLQDALDIATDEGNLKGYLVPDTDLEEYGTDGEGLTYLGNAGEAHDIESLDAIQLPNPPFSFVALFNAKR